MLYWIGWAREKRERGGNARAEGRGAIRQVIVDQTRKEVQEGGLELDEELLDKCSYKDMIQIIE